MPMASGLLPLSQLPLIALRNLPQHRGEPLRLLHMADTVLTMRHGRLP
jgi:hypothetical protein